MRSLALSAVCVAASCLAVSAIGVPAAAASCPGNPNALGTSRVLTISPAEYARIGNLQYSRYQQLPLNDREVVLTFDDGPLPPYTETVLKALAAECVKATFFMIGRQATAFPELVRRVHGAGHTIGTHSQNHPLTFDQMPLERAEREINDGIASVSAALGDPRGVAPFFRIPGLMRVAPVEDYLAGRSIAVWSADFDAEDWYKSVKPHDIVRKAMTRLQNKGRGVLLLHDVQPATALALPALLRELRVRGYRVVHVVPRIERPLVPPERMVSQHPLPPAADAKTWPRVVQTPTPRSNPAASRQRKQAVRDNYRTARPANLRSRRADSPGQGWQ